MTGARIIIRGRVQGVGLRAHIRSYCLQNGIGGRVMNLPDGSVLVEACAPQKRIDELLAYLHTLSLPGAKVQEVTHEPLKGPVPAKVFEIEL